ncbi:MAG: hypothetical protein EBT79_14880 [Actinobacteria bacterium]|nr:hypothetical protein [Actinomycetota bacterium]
MSALLVGTGLLFWMVVYAAAYRGQRQDIRNPAIVHVVFTGVGCVVAGGGLMLLGWALRGVTLELSDNALALAGATGAFLGMAAVAIPIWWFLPAIAAQPVDSDLAKERAERLVLQTEVDRLRRERNQWLRRATLETARNLREDAPSPWLMSREEV